jgi:hypothetical protein
MADYDVFLKELENEIAWLNSNKPMVFHFLNHFYGCVSILEMLANKEISSFDEFDFSKVGQLHGYYSGDAKQYVATTPYRVAWEWIWREYGIGANFDGIDKLEDDCFAKLRVFEEKNGMDYFAKALATGEPLAEEELNWLADANANEMPTEATATNQKATITYIPLASGSQNLVGIIQHKRYSVTRRHRAVTPLHYKRITAITHRRRKGLTAEQAQTNK